MRHSDWWDRLSSEDHQLLHDLGGRHGQAVQWLEQQLTEQGPMTWAAISAAIEGQELQAEVERWVTGAAFDDEHDFGDLENVLRRLQIDRLEHEAQELATQSTAGGDALVRLRELRQHIALLKAAAPAPTG